MLSTQNIKLTSCRKFKPRFIGPFSIVKRIGTSAYRLDLPPHMRIHNVFHVGLLKPYVVGTSSGLMPSPVLVDAGDPEFEVEALLKHRQNKRTRGR